MLIVCTGNSCRSVMAEGYMKKRLKDLGIDISVRSAGTAAVDGIRASDEAVKTMEEEGINISKHRSAALNIDMVKEADIILVMEPQHKSIISHMDPKAAEKVYFLREFDLRAEDTIMPDPIGHGGEYYETVFNAIKKSVEGFIVWLRQK